MVQQQQNFRTYGIIGLNLLFFIGIGMILFGVTYGRYEVVDTWCYFVWCYLDIRFWTWRFYFLFLIFSVIFMIFSRIKCGNFRTCRLIFLGIVIFFVLTIWRGFVEWSWNRDGHTFIVRQIAKKERANSKNAPLDYKIHVPRGFYSLGCRRPLIIFLHGAGNVGKDVEEIKEDLVNHLTPEMKRNFSFVVISPANWKHGWKTPQILQILEQVTVRWNIDPNRIYLTGYSMGGFGTFQIACDSPETFAAIVSVAGGGQPMRAERLNNVPTWAFHGDVDNVVSYDNSAKMIEAMQKTGCKEVKLTTLENAGHCIMNEVYSKPEIYHWMLEKKR
ncbi:MAG: prolyl oligopeptidase family serine peptidase [Planctomycetaceae bacterium]|jgi:predicted esterase|nr:prolyl oligopeptidase family serine peptidase [Planctomycetaceae bacterium]